MKPQTAAVLSLLRSKSAGVTPLDGLTEVGTFRLGARIHELRALGYQIETSWFTTPGGARVARYRLIEQLTLGVA